MAAAIMMPAVAVALGLCAVEAWRIMRPQSPLFAPRFVYSLADAIAGGDVRQAYEFIRQGQDPNAPIPVRDGELTDGQQVLVPPVVWATATQKPHVVRMLLAFGARLERPVDRQAVCLAEALGNDEIVGVLTAHGDGQPMSSCRPLEPGEAPLLRWLATVERS